jgi:hypothetical protein
MWTSHVGRGVIGGTAWIPVNSTRGLRPWNVSNALQTKYFGTAVKERETHWPKGQVMANLFGRSYRVIRTCARSWPRILLNEN